MIVFIVPVKSEKVSGDWNFFTKLFERCMKSICNQTSDNYKVVVSCHEIPKIEFSSNKIEFHQVKFTPPVLNGIENERQRELKEEDKANKILDGIEIAKKYHPTYIMVVDSDDCISNKIVEFVIKDKSNTPGWYVDSGYYYQEGKPYAFLKKNGFNKFCGSCIIIKNELVHQLFLKEPFLYYNHHTMVLDNNIELVPLPFTGSMYSMANGENHYMSLDKATTIAKKTSPYRVEFIRGLVSKLKKYRPKLIMGKFKKTFNFYQIK